MHLHRSFPLAAAVVAALAAGVAIRDAAGPDRTPFRRPHGIPFPAESPYSPQRADLGRQLFHDTILSGGRDRACVSCHRPELGWSDGLPKAAGLSGKPLPVRTPAIADLAWQPGRMGWDGKFTGVDAVAFGPITGAGNMNLTEAEALARLEADPGYAAAFARAFGSPGVTRPRVEAALGTYVRLIVSGPSPFDRFVAGDDAALSPAARRGFALFAGKANCAACHSGWSLSDGSFQDIGYGTDPGRGALVPGSVRLAHAHKTPGLRDVARRGGPYMHDGGLATLEAVVDLYDRGGTARPSRSTEIRPLGLTPAEKADLVAFLRALDSDPGTGPEAAPAYPAAPKS